MSEHSGGADDTDSDYSPFKTRGNIIEILEICFKCTISDITSEYFHCISTFLNIPYQNDRIPLSFPYVSNHKQKSKSITLYRELSDWQFLFWSTLGVPGHS